jgi:hypothetical protein
MFGERLTAAAGGIAVTALGILLVTVLVPEFVAQPSRVPANMPGPRTLPLILGWGLIIFGTIELLGIWLGGDRVRWRWPDGVGRLVLVGAIVLATLLATPYIGMLPACAIMMVAITTGASGQRLLPSVVTAALFVGAVYAIFILLAGIPLPSGSLWD